MYECAAIIEYLKETGQLDHDSHKRYYLFLEELSKMLFAMIKGLS